MKPARTIVITGVTRGLGHALTAEFIRRGHVVAGCGRAHGAIAELQTAYLPPHSFAAVDLTKEAAVNAWAAEVLANLGPPDLLINNAAVVNRNAPLWEVSAAEFAAVIDTNITAVARVIRHFVPAMVDRGKGVIVNLSSGWGRSTSPHVAPYCASKWAIEGLTRALAQELPRGMAAVPLNPGIINTDMLRTSFGGDASGYPTAEEWASTAAPFLLRLGAKDNGKPATAP